MIIELNDIAEGKKVFGHIPPLPEGVPLGRLFEKHGLKDVPELGDLANAVIQASVNGMRVNDWRNYKPGANDRISLVIGPRGPALAFLGPILSALSALVTIAQFIISLFASPQVPKPTSNKQESGTYAFEGIRDTFQLGSPISVTYGKHRKGGQVLMYYLSMMPGNKGTKMHMLMSLGEGPVEAVDAIELNNQPVSQLTSVTVQIQLGQSSQGIPTGFERIKNTFHDGREITDKQKNGGRTRENTPSSQIYRTNAYDVEAVDYFVVAPNGVYRTTLEGAFANNWSKYTIEYRPAGVGSMDENAAPWTLWDTRRISNKKAVPIWDNGNITFPRPGQYDLRFTWVNARFQWPGRAAWFLNLADITEIRGPSNAFSSEVIVAVDAAPTAQLQGGQPNLTALVSGRKVDVYSSTTVYSNQWTDNPAWNMIDWMTNSRYGLGADIQTSDIDIQSFIDFATLANSLAETCASSDSSNCPQYGTANFFDGVLFISSLEPMWTGDQAEQRFTLRSKYAGENQNGLIFCKPCCPPDYGYGVNSTDYLNSWLSLDMYITSDIGSSRPIFGIVNYVRSGTNQFSGTFYGMIINTVSQNILLCRWNGASPNTYGTILATYSYGLPHSGDEIYMAIDNNYDLASSYGGSNNWINVYVDPTTGAIIDQEYIDTSASRIPFSVLDRSIGVIAIKTPVAGDNHAVSIHNVYAETGLCYAGIGHHGSHELTCIQNIPYYSAVR